MGNADMKRFIEGEDRTQITLLPECLDDYIAEDNPIRVVEVFIDELDLGMLRFAPGPNFTSAPPRAAWCDTVACRAKDMDQERKQKSSAFLSPTPQ